MLIFIYDFEDLWQGGLPALSRLSAGMAVIKYSLSYVRSTILCLLFEKEN